MHLFAQALRAAALAVTLVAASMTALAQEKGYFGFAIAVDAEGFSFNPTLKSVAVDKVAAGSPAAIAGLAKGDQFIEIEGKPVAGAKADDLKPYLSRNVGDTVHFKMRKVSGELVSVALTAAKKP